MKNRHKRIEVIVGVISIVIIMILLMCILDSRRQDALTSDNTVLPISNEIPELENEEVPMSVQEEISEPQKEDLFSPELGENPEPINEENWMQKIQQGDFSCLADDRSLEMKHVYESSSTPEKTEWVQYDINEDGMMELIWQEKEGAGGDIFKRIMGIYTYQEGAVTCNRWDVIDVTEYCFLGENGKLAYYMDDFGVTQSMHYAHCVMDSETGIKYDYWLSIYNVYDISEVYDSWGEEHPDMMEEGIYYRKRIPGPDQSEEQQCLTREQFLTEFYELTGVEFGDRDREFIGVE